MASSSVVLVVLCCVVACFAVDQHAIPLHNTAKEGVAYPFVGLGTGGYGLDVARKYPECWIEQIGCGKHTSDAVSNWLKNGGVRIDSANSYFNQNAVAKGIKESGVDRKNMFITSKVGPSLSLGYNDTLEQMKDIKQKLEVDYVDLLLIHWPTGSVKSSDPACQTGSSTYNETQCRLNTWSAMIEIFKAGDALAVGVSNFNTTHLEEIKQSGLPMPAVNQCPFNVYRSATQSDVINYCKENNILFNAYSPFGIPDLTVDGPKAGSALYHKYPEAGNMSANILDDPEINTLAETYKRTPAQVILNWMFQRGIPTNPRTMNVTHMLENLNSFDFNMTEQSVAIMNSRPQDYCKTAEYTDQWYECAPN